MNHDISYLGIDIGGANLKIIGVNENKQIVYVDYSSCKIWNNQSYLDKKLLKLNRIKTKKKIKCGITMSAELCDCFKNREFGAKQIFKSCENLIFDCFFYSKSKSSFLKKDSYSNIISMNWHSIGRFLKKRIKNAIVIDFGTTTTDFIIIKKGRILNKNYDDFSRLNNNELLYTGFTRTPIFGISQQIRIQGKLLNIIPEFFSDSADVNKIIGQLNTSIDIDKTADGLNRSYFNSSRRISRSFGFDYKKSKRSLIKKICIELSSIQINKVFANLLKIQKKFSVQDFPIILSGVGQEVVNKFLKKRGVKTIKFENFLIPSKLNKEASSHAPAVSIALLIGDLK